MPVPVAAPMAADTRHPLAPQPAPSARYEAIGRTLRWLQDAGDAVELFRDDAGDVWAIPGPVLATLMDRVETAIADRVTSAG
jgi:hypothetical protein